MLQRTAAESAQNPRQFRASKTRLCAADKSAHAAPLTHPKPRKTAQTPADAEANMPLKTSASLYIPLNGIQEVRGSNPLGSTIQPQHRIRPVVAATPALNGELVQVRVGLAHGGLDVLMESIQRVVEYLDAPPNRRRDTRRVILNWNRRRDFEAPVTISSASSRERTLQYS